MNTLLLFPTYLFKAIIRYLSLLKYVGWYFTSLFKLGKRPHVVIFAASEQNLIRGAILKLQWRTENASFVYISGIGAFRKKQETAIPITFEKKVFKLNAYGFLRKTSKSITVYSHTAPVKTALKPTVLVNTIENTSTQFLIKHPDVKGRTSNILLKNKRLKIVEFLTT